MLAKLGGAVANPSLEETAEIELVPEMQSLGHLFHAEFTLRQQQPRPIESFLPQEGVDQLVMEDFISEDVTPCGLEALSRSFSGLATVWTGSHASGLR